MQYYYCGYPHSLEIGFVDYQWKFNNYLVQGCTDKIEKYLNIHDVNVNYRNEYNVTPLLYAVITQQLEMVKLLLAYNANVNEMHRSNLYRAPIHFSTFMDDLDITKLLIRNMCNIDAIDGVGNTPLHLACKYNYTHLMRLLVKSGADVNAMDFGKRTPIFYSQTYQAKKFLIANGAHIHIRDIDGNGLLSLAVDENNHHFLKLLIENGINLNEENVYGIKIIHFIRSDKMFDLLYNFDVDLESKDSTNRTLLHMACLHGHYNIVKKLMKYGLKANINDIDKWNGTPLQGAMNNGSNCFKIITLLLYYGAKVHHEDKFVLNLCTNSTQPNDYALLKWVALYLTKHNEMNLNIIIQSNEYQSIHSCIIELMKLKEDVIPVMTDTPAVNQITYLKYILYTFDYDTIENLHEITNLSKANETVIIDQYPIYATDILTKMNLIEKWFNSYSLAITKLHQMNTATIKNHNVIRIIVNSLSISELIQFCQC